MKLQRRFEEGRAAARRAGGVAGLYWKCRHPLERKRKELVVPDKQLDNDKTGNRAADDSELQTQRRDASKLPAAEDWSRAKVKAVRGSEPVTGRTHTI